MASTRIVPIESSEETVAINGTTVGGATSMSSVPSGVVKTRPTNERAKEVCTSTESCALSLLAHARVTDGLMTSVARDSIIDGNRRSDSPDSIRIKASGKVGRRGGLGTISKNVPYTRSGDTGTSQLFAGERRSKTDITFEAMGTVDELCCVVGVIHAELIASTGNADTDKYGKLPEWLTDVMSRLFDCGSYIARPPKHKLRNEGSDYNEDNDDCADDQASRLNNIGGSFDARHVERLEERIDIMIDQLPELVSFILPTGGRASALLHVARTVCRRAERRIAGLVRDGVCDPSILRYLNRLSDFFFTAARWTNYCDGQKEIQYRRPRCGAKQRVCVQASLKEGQEL